MEGFFHFLKQQKFKHKTQKPNNQQLKHHKPNTGTNLGYNGINKVICSQYFFSRLCWFYAGSSLNQSTGSKKSENYASLIYHFTGSFCIHGVCTA